MGWASSYGFPLVVQEIVKANKAGTPEFTTRDRLTSGGVCDSPDFRGKCTSRLRDAFDAAAKQYASGQHEKYSGLFPPKGGSSGLQLFPDVPKWIPFAIAGGIVLLFLVIR